MVDQLDIAAQEFLVPLDAAPQPGQRSIAWIDGAPLSSSPRITRLIDIVGSLFLLALFLPIFAIIAVLIKLTDRGPVFFGHGRIGRGGAPFSCYKFRSMVVDADARLAELLATNPTARLE